MDLRRGHNMKKYFYNKIPKKRFDWSIKPTKNFLPFKFVSITLSKLQLLRSKPLITKVDMKKIKGPYVLLPNHINFIDYFMIISAVFPKGHNWCAGYEAFFQTEKSLRLIGGFPKRRFINDNMYSLKNYKHVLNEVKQILVLFPEGHYCVDGTFQGFPESFAKILKLLNYPVVTYKMEGNYIKKPFYNVYHERKAKVRGTLTGLYTPEELQAASTEEIHAKITQHLEHDDYAYQRENNLHINYAKNAEGLHRILYQCPACKTEFKMNSLGNDLFCEACGKKWHLDSLNILNAESGDTEFPYIPDWYKWQKEEVKAEIESGKYSIDETVKVDWLVNPNGFVKLGEGNFKHDENGISLSFVQEGENVLITREPEKMYSIHLDGCFVSRMEMTLDLAVGDTAYYLYFKENPNQATKVKIAIEYLYHKIKAE